jgi:hypothetical protein
VTCFGTGAGVGGGIVGTGGAGFGVWVEGTDAVFYIDPISTVVDSFDTMLLWITDCCCCWWHVG